MTTEISVRPPERFVEDALVVFVPEGEAKAHPRSRRLATLDARLHGQIAPYLRAKLFTGKADQAASFVVPGERRLRRIVLCGVGPEEMPGEEALRRAVAVGARLLGARTRTAYLLPATGQEVERSAENVVVAHALTRYTFTEFKKAPRPKSPPVLVVAKADAHAARRGAASGEAIAAGVVTARDLGNLPGNVGTPRELARRAAAVAKSAGLRVRTLDERRIRRLGMGSFASVARGSDEPPRLIVLEYGKASPSTRTICLVGKGLTFDSGGISIKPAADMDKMRHDKCGGAAVIGAMEAAARLRLPVHLVGIVPASENMPGPSANKPGDVVTAMDGTTIEILNTDAEGRLILADALLYARRFRPAVIVDLATLTGAVSVALGKHMAGALGNDEETLHALAEAGQAVHERVWPLPLGDDYAEAMKGKHTDLKNLGGRDAGTITAACFLAHFAGRTPWVHLDIAGVAYDDPARPYAKGPGASGFGVRLLVRWLEARARGGAARKARRRPARR